MNADEVVRALRCVQEKHRNDRLLTFQTDVSAMARDAADMIESLQAQLSGKTSLIDVNKSLLDAAVAESKRLNQELIASQRRVDAAVEDLSTYKDCGFCIHLRDQQYCYKNCQRHVDVDNFRTHPCWQWRGLPEVEAEREKGCEYCRGNVKELVDGDTTIFINHEDKVFYADWSGSDYLDWKHCPMCGRRLEVRGGD